MNQDGFWDLIERSANLHPDPQDRLEWLTAQLGDLPLTEIEDFEIQVQRERLRADSWLMWGAANLICDGLCSDDGFWYFQVWLIGLGRDAFERVVADPDALAEVPEVRRLAGRSVDAWDDNEWPEWESLDYVAAEAHERHTGVDQSLYDALDERGFTGRSSPQPQDEQWELEDPAELERRFPRLSRMFTLSDRRF